MMHFNCYTPIAIAAFIFKTDLFYGFLFNRMFFRLILMLQVIIKAAPGEFGCYQEFF
jgi:hypothetical protein